MPALEQVLVQRQRDRQVGARPRREVQVGLPRERRRARIDDDELSRRACRASLMNGTRWMPDADGLTPHRTISRAWT